MSGQKTLHHPAQKSHQKAPGWAKGFILFAGVMMMITGTFEIVAGFAGIITNEFYVTTPNYVLEFDATIWGVIHLLLGVLVVFAGLGVLSGNRWGRIVGIGLVGFSALANFAFLPHFPFWATIIIAFDVFIIYTLAVHGEGAKL
ncbi:MAG: hypothetical protein ABWX96_09395 [Propionibacteriaceae bacterium]